MKDFAKTATGLIIGAVVFFAFSVLAFGQAQTGTLRGTVTDPNGGVVAGATVSAKNQSSGVTSANFQTNGEGVYVITNLVPGKYTVTVEQAGFKKKSVVDVDVTLGAV